MNVNHKTIQVIVDQEEVEVLIYGEDSKQTLFEVPDACDNGEAYIQIQEGCFYEYKITSGFLLEASEIVIPSKIIESNGRIAPNIYVGTLSINILRSRTKEKCADISLEVQSVKTSYRNDYRDMLEEITDHCVELVLQQNSPVSQFFEVDFEADSKTVYQRFAFIKSILDTEEFNAAIHKIFSSHVTTWQDAETLRDTRRIKRFTNANLRQMNGAANRINLPANHPLRPIFDSIPTTLHVYHKIETVDTPENRFIKHALISFKNICSQLTIGINGNTRLKQEALLLEDKIENWISHQMFNQVSTPITLPLNSPILQRKSGYRDVLRTWLMFNLAAKLIWNGGNDVYKGNKRDVAVLYEYWLFFKLLDIVKNVFKIEAKSINELIKETPDGLGLQLQQGKYLPIKGVFFEGTRKLEIEFSYNRTFTGGKVYPEAGSWTESMRPDYTLSIWPYGIDAKAAEKEELIVHLHFDAKYKIEKLTEILGNEKNFQDEKEDQRKGTFKRADLLKMHAYKDAIRRTGGAYILYPGSVDKYVSAGFHEVIPGLGAFCIRPSKANSGVHELQAFLSEVVGHFMNRASLREKISLNQYETYKVGKADQLIGDLPETIGINRSLLPDSTFVLVAYYKSREHLDWILTNGLYNARAGNDRGSLRLGPGETSAKYLLLHTKNQSITSMLLRIIETGPRIFSRQMLLDSRYPTFPSQDYYLIYKISQAMDKEFINKSWDISKLAGFTNRYNASLPFSITLTELMHVLRKM